ncbi:RNA-binding S4 domain-containing protein [Magnetospirillum sp. UT-4]|uniref:RNA-binding S4 domain-containing protein n=1 Tax=Magnetospirillum sp. UT-4 TaxID=2681467 RepID=UPI00137CE6D9|nr:RNA-binding S4 domain-containing protein [Magnetospirillum sp. UT-4]CAA7616426.1 Ribosome-associated heat shock protein Hsp15 [Magnetospirillum sp. UT-4]
MPETLRLDKWLWFARFFKSRSLAAAVVESGAVRLNGVGVAKPSHPVRPGDELVFPTGPKRRRVTVLALPERRGPAAAARASYREEEPPPPDPDEFGRRRAGNSAKTP